MARAQRRRRPWPSSAEQARLSRSPRDYSHLQPTKPCLWYAGDRWRDGLLLEVNRAAGALVVGRHYGGEVTSFRIRDGRNVQQLNPLLNGAI